VHEENFCIILLYFFSFIQRPIKKIHLKRKRQKAFKRTSHKNDYHQSMKSQSCHFTLPANVPHVLKMDKKFLDKANAQLLASSKEKYIQRMKAAEECSSRQ